jgi:ketohexokinase
LHTAKCTFRVPKFPVEDEKLRATSLLRRRGGNCANTLEVLSQLVSQDIDVGFNACKASIADPQLHLLAVLPDQGTEDVRVIRKSLKNVKMIDSCIFRSGYEHAATSYIIQNTLNNTRTIVSHNSLPEMTIREFIVATSQLDQSKGWYHFEGRDPKFILQCIDHLRSTQPGFKISVECEKPERTEMAIVAQQADVVFYSKLWVEVSNH